MRRASPVCRAEIYLAITRKKHHLLSKIIPKITHKNNETNKKFYRKVAFLMYTEMVNFRPHR